MKAHHLPDVSFFCWETNSRDSRGSKGFGWSIHRIGDIYVSPPSDYLYGWGDETDALADLAGFLDAWQEAKRYNVRESENGDLFPKSLEWVLPYIEDFSAAMYDHKENA